MLSRTREADQIRRHFGLTFPVENAYDEYTADIPENQLLRASAECLLRVPGVNRPTPPTAPPRASLGRIAAELGDAVPVAGA
ncbi:5-methylcytosine restriction system specificity protein McrC [Streptomyces sp. NPDC002076]